MLKIVRHRLVEKLKKHVTKCEAELKNMSMWRSVVEELSEKEDSTSWDNHMIEEAKVRFVIALNAYERQRTKAIKLNKILRHI